MIYLAQLSLMVGAGLFLADIIGGSLILLLVSVNAVVVLLKYFQNKS